MQRTRIQAGERIRAVLQGHTGAEAGDAVRVLAAIRSGKADGPVAILGQTYRRNWEAEQEARRALHRLLGRHPAWPWLSRVRGVGPSLAGRLLARLDPSRAATVSAFWKYCGLATVPGAEYRCERCGRHASFPMRARVTGSHTMLGAKYPCPGTLVLVRGPEDGARIAQPRPTAGQPSPYDQQAKKICYLIGTSFLRSGGSYAEWYRARKRQLERDRSGWSPSRIHLTALRRTEKLFLAHLWLVWRRALCLPVSAPYAKDRLDLEMVDPWRMVDQRGPAASDAADGGKAGSPRPLPARADHRRARSRNASRNPI